MIKCTKNLKKFAKTEEQPFLKAPKYGEKNQRTIKNIDESIRLKS